MSVTVPPPAAIEYPCSDGKPAWEDDWQATAVMYLRGALSVRYAKCPKVYLSGNLFIYYEKGNPQASVSPDLFVVFGAAKRMRLVYKVWEEGQVPDFVVEVAAASKWKEDEGPKRALYERLGVREYWQLDPRGEYLPSRLQGWRLRGAVYEPQTVEEPLDGMLMLRSETLGLDLLASQSGELYFCDPVSGERLLGHQETEAARRVAEARAKQAAAAREAEAAGRRLAEARVEQEVATRQAKAARRRLADSPAEGFAAVRQAEADARRWAEEWIAELEALLVRGKRG